MVFINQEKRDGQNLVISGFLKHFFNVKVMNIKRIIPKTENLR